MSVLGKLLGLDWLARKLGYVEQDVRIMRRDLTHLVGRVQEHWSHPYDVGCTCAACTVVRMSRALERLQGMVERPLIEGASVPDGCERVLVATLRCKACQYSVPGTGEHNCAAIPYVPVVERVPGCSVCGRLKNATTAGCRCPGAVAGWRDP